MPPAPPPLRPPPAGLQHRVYRDPEQHRAGCGGQCPGRALHLDLHHHAAAAGTLDSTFGTDGYAEADVAAGADTALAVAIQSDGRIVVAGNVNGDTTPALARFNADGTLDTSFGTPGVVVLESLAGLANGPMIVVVGIDASAATDAFYLTRIWL